MKNKTFDQLMEGIKILHDNKNEDYADKDNPYSNFEFASLLVREFSDPIDQVFVCLIGMKLARLSQLLSGKKPHFESIQDTMMDLTTYCGIWTVRRIDQEYPIDFDKMVGKAVLPPAEDIGNNY